LHLFLGIATAHRRACSRIQKQMASLRVNRRELHFAPLSIQPAHPARLILTAQLVERFSDCYVELGSTHGGGHALAIVCMSLRAIGDVALLDFIGCAADGAGRIIKKRLFLIV